MTVRRDASYLVLTILPDMLGWLPGIGDLTGNEYVAQSFATLLVASISSYAHELDRYNLLDPTNSSSEKIFVGKGASYCTNPDPNHDFPDTGVQIYAPGPVRPC